MPPGDPIFKSVFGKDWDQLPPVMKKHYAVRANSNDRVVVRGKLDIKISPLVSILAKISGMLLAYSGKDIPVTVEFYTEPNSLKSAGKKFYFDRTFHFPDKGDVTFQSKMEQITGNQLVEFMGFGVGWHLSYHWADNKVILRHKGYVWRLFGKLIPLPLSLILGRGYAEETPLSEDDFAMWTHALHPLFGATFGYAGDFKVTEILCDSPS